MCGKFGLFGKRDFPVLTLANRPYCWRIRRSFPSPTFIRPGGKKRKKCFQNLNKPTNSDTCLKRRTSCVYVWAWLSISNHSKFISRGQKLHFRSYPLSRPSLHSLEVFGYWHYCTTSNRPISETASLSLFRTVCVPSSWGMCESGCVCVWKRHPPCCCSRKLLLRGGLLLILFPVAALPMTTYT